MLRFINLLALITASIAPAAAQTTQFTKVADSSTPIPGGSGNFAKFSNMVSLDGSGDVGFSEFDSGSNDGLHFWSSNVITRAADLSSPIPSGTGNFTDFSFFGNGIDDGTFAFRGHGSSDQVGLYTYDHNNGGGGILSMIANASTLIPDGTGNFTSFTTGYVDGDDVAFIASGSSDQQGIYLWNGSALSRIADKTTAVTEIGGTYGWSSQLGFDGGNIAFWSNVSGGSSPGNIVGGYTPGSGLITLATTGTAVPGLAATFTGFTSPVDLSGSTAAFCGLHTGGSGIYVVDLAGGPITTIVRAGNAAPGGGGSFTSFDPPAIDGDVIAFRATSGSGISGIYLRHEGRIRKVISTTDKLEGKTITALAISENSLAGGYLAFRVFFSDMSRGIYRLTISELVDAPEKTIAEEKAELKKAIQQITKKLKKARKAGQRAKVKRFAAQLRKIKRELLQL